MSSSSEADAAVPLQSDSMLRESTDEAETGEQIIDNQRDLTGLDNNTLNQSPGFVLFSSTTTDVTRGLPTAESPIPTSPSQNEEQQQQQQQQRTTGTNTRSNLERYPNEWDSNEVLIWFQSFKLNELYNILFASLPSIDGAGLAEIFDLKFKNYELYKIRYQNRIPLDQKNILKDFDRFGELLDTYFTDKYTHRFDVAFSFPGDIRDRVSQIAEKLCGKIQTQQGEQRVFYDNYHQPELARPNLDLYLHTIYRYQTRLIVVFMCDVYRHKEWCGLESRAIRDLLKTHQSDRIMLLTVDGKTIDGVSSIDGYLDISNKDDDYVANAIYSRLQALGKRLSSRSIYPPPPQLSTSENMILKSIMVFKNIFHSISPWYIVIALLSYILGTLVGR